MSQTRETTMVAEEKPNTMNPQETPGGKPDSPPAAAKGNGKFRLIITLVVLAIAAAGAYYYLSGVGKESTEDAQVDGHIVNVASKISGNVIEVAVNDNQQVKAGQVLVRIDPRDYQVRIDQLRAAVGMAQSQIQSAQATVPMTSETTRSEVANAEAQLGGAQAEFERSTSVLEQASESEISYAKANIASKQANYERAQADLNRMKDLVAKEEISRQQFDSFVAAERVAASELEAAKERLASASKSADIAKASLGSARSKVLQAQAAVQQSKAGTQMVAVRSADVGSTRANLEASRANLAAAELQLSYATITAPMDGIVTRKTVENGGIIQPGQTLMTLIPSKDVWVTANFKETQLAGVKPGQPVQIKVDMNGKTIRGKVDSIASATGSRLSLLPPENATGNYVKVVQRIPVKIQVDPQDLEQTPLRVGMNVEATILTK